MIPSLQAELDILGADSKTFERWYVVFDEAISRLSLDAARDGDEPASFYAAIFLAAAARCVVFTGQEGRIAEVASAAFRMFQEILYLDPQPKA